MTPEQAIAIVRDVAIGPGGFTSWNMSLYAEEKDGFLYVSVGTEMPDRDTGESQPMYDSMKYRVADLSKYTATTFLRSVRENLGKFVLHELDESILYLGSRLFDPHRGEREQEQAA